MSTKLRYNDFNLHQNTVDGSEIPRPPVEVGRFSRYLQGFCTIQNGGFILAGFLKPSTPGKVDVVLTPEELRVEAPSESPHFFLVNQMGQIRGFKNFYVWRHNRNPPNFSRDLVFPPHPKMSKFFELGDVDRDWGV